MRFTCQVLYNGHRGVISAARSYFIELHFDRSVHWLCSGKKVLCLTRPIQSLVIKINQDNLP